jgi:hypothetical protein
LNGAFNIGNSVGIGFAIFPNTLGWNATHNIEIGYGKVYNSNWPNGTHITELDPTQNTIISQILKFDALNRFTGTG